MPRLTGQGSRGHAEPYAFSVFRHSTGFTGGSRAEVRRQPIARPIAPDRPFRYIIGLECLTSICPIPCDCRSYGPIHIHPGCAGRALDDDRRLRRLADRALQLLAVHAGRSASGDRSRSSQRQRPDRPLHRLAVQRLAARSKGRAVRFFGGPVAVCVHARGGRSDPRLGSGPCRNEGRRLAPARHPPVVP
jgi:hypothetical protein